MERGREGGREGVTTVFLVSRLQFRGRVQLGLHVICGVLLALTVTSLFYGKVCGVPLMPQENTPQPSTVGLLLGTYRDIPHLMACVCV